MLGLPAHRLLPLQIEPGEVLIDRGLVFRPAARGVDVLDPQQQSAGRYPCPVGVEQRRQRMAEMQIAVRRRREAENGWQIQSHGSSIYRLAWYTDSMTHFLHTEADLQA